MRFFSHKGGKEDWQAEKWKWKLSIVFITDGSTTSLNPFACIRTDNRVANGLQSASAMLAFRPDAGGIAVVSRSVMLPFDGQDWNHLVLVEEAQIDGSATRKLYIDGTEDTNAFPAKPAPDTYSLLNARCCREPVGRADGACRACSVLAA